MGRNLNYINSLAENTPSIHYHSYATILLIACLSFFGAEILTGSTSVEGIFQYPVSFLMGLGFYGFQITIIADISSRYNLKLGTIYILGLIYGILEEGISIFTMEATGAHKLWLTAFGLNLTWTLYVMILHAVVTVITTLFILRVIWPKKLQNPILSKRNYMIMVPVIMLIYYFLMVASISAGRVPGILPVILLILLLFVLIFAAWKNSQIERMRKKERIGTGVKYGVLIPFAAGMILPFILGNRLPEILIPETLALLLLTVYLFLYFNRFDTIVNIKRKFLWSFSSIILIIMLVGGSFNRTVPSDVLAIIACVIFILFGYMKVRRTEKDKKCVIS